MQHTRPLCKSCHRRVVAINYVRNGRTHYRRRCEQCSRKRKPARARWQQAGYKKKPHCEKCGFKSRWQQQFFVYHTDGNLNNVDLTNLRTVCANCQIEIAITGLGWAQGDLVPDF